ncbi:alpha/beta hydrolase [Deinococcus aetherius]|uniref:Alpha/beta hydrolase n=2 Tax=Deinococcus aetherius TaxID=200252 RepID=A0ABM8ABD3_9DEIO|nr:alpha/beta hydrolase [Deinococcus aetherius]
MDSQQPQEIRAGYVEVAGLSTWHEVGGRGPAVVLLHGGFSGASSWAAQASALREAGFRVYVPERRGHAHTPDVEGPFGYGVMADDMVAYLDQVVGGPADLVGWSDGAVVAVLVALTRPDLVRRLVLIGQYYNSSGKLPNSPLLAFLRSPQAVGYLRQEYDAVSPDGPGHFPVVFAKMMAMIEQEPELDLDRLREVNAPTLVLQGDQDEVTLGHSIEVVSKLAGGRLAVLPGGHALPMECPEVVGSLLVFFLRAGMAQGDEPGTPRG